MDLHKSRRSLICNVFSRLLSMEPFLSPFREDFFFEATIRFQVDLQWSNFRA